MSELIGRKNEQAELEQLYTSQKAEFVLIYGRRRVGKTFLIKQFFHKKKNTTFFYVTGVQDGLLEEQLQEFSRAIGESFYHGARIAPSESWMQAFEELNKAILNQPKKQKIILFMDEFPWMATKKSRLIQALEYYWNRHWNWDSRVKLIICGSSASWLVKKILYQKGGLHNRTTKQIILKPFCLEETKLFLSKNNINLNALQILELYLAIGGIPFYLAQIQKNKSVTWNINRLCFTESGLLFNEFDKLFSSLFKNHEHYISLIRLISQTRYGISRNEIEKLSKSSLQGGRLTERLNDLEMAGFIKSFLPLIHSKRGLYYRVVDEFCYFYLKWIEPEKPTLLMLPNHHHYWMEKTKSPGYQAWAGYAFETLCYKHISPIQKTFHILDDAKIGVWRFAPKEKDSEEQGAQIDLVFDQSDSITLCEIKYTNTPFVIDKDYFEKISNKILVFKKITKTTKQIFFNFISVNGIKENPYSKKLVDGVVTIEDLMKSLF